MCVYKEVATVPENLTWHVSQVSMGQTIEIAYADERPHRTPAEFGSRYKRVVDLSEEPDSEDRCTYYVRGAVRRYAIQLLDTNDPDFRRWEEWCFEASLTLRQTAEAAAKRARQYGWLGGRVSLYRPGSTLTAIAGGGSRLTPLYSLEVE